MDVDTTELNLRPSTWAPCSVEGGASTERRRRWLFIHLAAFWSSNLLEIAQEVFGMLRFPAVFAYPLRCFCRTGAKQGYITSRAIVVERVPPPQDIATTFVWATKAQWHNSNEEACTICGLGTPRCLCDEEISYVCPLPEGVLATDNEADAQGLPLGLDAFAFDPFHHILVAANHRTATT